MVTFGDKCSWCGCVICECKQEKITMTDDYLAKNYIRKKVLRKLVERIKDKADDAYYVGMEHRRYAAYRECADEIEAVLNKGCE